MSASPVARQVTQSQVIPSRRVLINNSADLPNDYSTTPGGTFFSTTPGGTRIVYERQFLMQLRNSPMARTPPTNIQYVPGGGGSPNKKSGLCENNNSTQKSVINSNQKSPDRLAPDNARVSPIAQSRPAGDSDMFEMDL
uniref:Eukaryotic translation initiation factor 4E-binding protein n=1 Tax=Hypogastrura harveyi TaxID=351090 RepID=A0A6G6CI54_9HEXA|nr:eukaryotic translation initiation factor 4E-binding protein [Hypogastrura harveyi]